MVIETFNDADPAPIGRRLERQGRMLPESVSYVASWVEAGGGRCFQVLQAPDRTTLDVWIARWSDLVTFEVVPVLTSQDFWAQQSH
jgi:Domain of unknown function (DUF3303)